MVSNSMTISSITDFGSGVNIAFLPVSNVMKRHATVSARRSDCRVCSLFPIETYNRSDFSCSNREEHDST